MPDHRKNKESRVTQTSSDSNPRSSLNASNSKANTPVQEPCTSESASRKNTSYTTGEIHQVHTPEPLVASALPKSHDPVPEKRSFLKVITSCAKSLHWTLIAALILALTAYTAASATWRHGPLALYPSHGILVLSILSKAGDVSLAMAAGAMWDELCWGLTTHGVAVRKFLALNTTTGPFGLLKLLFDIKPKAKNDEEKKHRGLSMYLRIIDWWSLLRIIMILVLPIPGIFIMSGINTETIYRPIQTSNIVGGLGVYDPSLAAMQTFPNSYVWYLLKDSSISVPVEPINSDCKMSDSCMSYLLPGGLSTVFPWAIRRNSQEKTDSYITEDAPAYQMDFWDGPLHLDFNPSSCNMYGMSNQVLQLCIASYGSSSGYLVAGYRVCSNGTESFPGHCLNTGDWNGDGNWTTFLAIYRRPATVVFSLINNNILKIMHLGPAVAQKINPSDLFIGINTAVLWPRQNATTACSSIAPQWITVVEVLSYLQLQAHNLGNKLGTLVLCNILASPMYVYNSMQWVLPQSLNISELELPAENHITGRYAVAEVRVVPQMWTVWTYIGVGAALILIMATSLTFTSIHYYAPKRSEFPVLDFKLLVYEKFSRRPVDIEAKDFGNAGMLRGKLGDKFEEIKATNGGVLEITKDLKVVCDPRF